MSAYKPEIIAFFCQWCAYAAADNAGRSRIEFPENLKVVRVMCSGRVDPEFVLTAIKEGADGVLIVGCLDGNCHYKIGNRETSKRIILLHSLLKPFNIESERVRFEGIKADDPEGLLKIIKGFINKVSSLRPLSGI